MATYDAQPELHKVDAGRATAWFGEGWQLFSAAPGVWIAITVVLMVIYLVLGLVPGIGQIASALLTPVFTAGLMQCSRTAAAGTPLQFELMFSGFRRNTGNLVMLGLLTLVGFVLISIAAFAILGVIGGASLLSAIQSGTFSGIDVGATIGAVLLALLVWMLLALPLTMAIWFAPALVFFDGIAPFDALKSSFRACLRNWLSLSIYGLVLMLLAFIATIPFGLGWLVLIPVTAASIYFSYRDIYAASSE
jgi:uncharacterized membrane protein